MRQAAKQPKRTRRKHCKYCDEFFDADPRAKGRQRYCSKAQCQTARQMQNQKDWCRDNPEVVAYDKRRWQQKHPGYSCQRRVADPAMAEQNRQDTKIRMQQMRSKAVFDKSKVILTQVIDKNVDKCCLIRGGWLFLRLTRVSPLRRAAIMRHTGHGLKQVANQLPKGKLYDLSGVIKSRDYG